MRYYIHIAATRLQLPTLWVRWGPFDWALECEKLVRKLSPWTIQTCHKNSSLREKMYKER